MASTVSFTVDSPRGLRTVEVSYERTGVGAPLVLLHGIGHHRQAWDPVLRILAAERDVIAVDLPGFGASPALPHGLAHDLRTMVPVLGSFFEALGVVRPHVAGNSLGGLLALELGREGLARSVTALSPAGFWTPSERRYAFGVLRAMRGAALAMPMPLIERLSRSSPGRAALTSTIYARPGRRSPAAVVSETVALREATGFRQTLEAGSGVTFADDVPGVPVSKVSGIAAGRTSSQGCPDGTAPKARSYGAPQPP
ncbi:alpha/beta fold hydrolase [[Kitasatospora] papulosa]|uniref:alpha/beta fold hydrolase n=1 Tax=[Kitasatospora] papulosa TaxID=1464011 RepID=UPI00369199A6